MESKEVPPSPLPACFHHRPLQACFHFHWVSPPFLCSHKPNQSNASIPCPSPGFQPPCFFNGGFQHHYVLPCAPHACCHSHMPSSCPANTAPAEEEPPASHIAAQVWHRGGHNQPNQDGAVEDAYELEEEEEEPVFVLTDEWMEFFAKSEARRQQKKKQQQKEAKKLHKAARSAPKKHDGEVEISDSAAHGSADASSSVLS